MNCSKMIFEMDIIKVSTNTIYAGVHWGKRKKYKDDYLLLVKGLRLKTRFKNPVVITFDFYFKSKPLDCSNNSFMGKMIEDALVKCGIIKDDTYENVTAVTYRTHKAKRDYVKIEVTNG